MPDKEQQGLEQQDLAEKLEKFSEVLRKRTREFHETGRFSNLQRNFLNNIEKTNESLRAKITQAAREKDSWAFTRAELRRDYEAMINEFVTLNDGVDADALKKA